MKYTGVGSRACPLGEREKLTRIAQILAIRKHILRSGAAEGADKAFEIGHLLVNENMEIYIPWRKFVNEIKPYHIFNVPHDIEKQAEEIVSKIHPAWNKCSMGAKKLHIRNVFQVLGSSLIEPSDFLISWTPNGEDIGGTATALKLARENNVPIFNVGLLEYINSSAMEIVKIIAQKVTGL